MNIPFLTVGESKVYESLIELGESTVGNILKHSCVSHSKVYDILKRLEIKGLVSSISRNGRQTFSPSEPSKLLELVREEKKNILESEKIINEVVKQLSVRRNTSSPHSVLQAFEGWKGTKNIIDSTLDKIGKKDTIFILGSPKLWGERFGGYMIEWQKRRLKTGAKCYILVDADTPSWDFDWWKNSKKQGITFTKRASFKAPSYLIITKESVVTIHVGEQMIALLVKHQGIAQRYKEFFMELWKK